MRASDDTLPGMGFRLLFGLMLLCTTAVFALFLRAQQAPPRIELAQGVMAGEVTSGSAILQSRLTLPTQRVDLEWSSIPPASGFARFAYSTSASMANATRTDILQAEPENDSIVKAVIRDLRPGTTYYYRLEYGGTRELGQQSQVAQFRTNDDASTRSSTSFAVVTGMNYSFFHHLGGGGYPPATGEEKRLGYPGLKAIADLAPQHFIGTGDNVYYDHPALGRAQSLHEIRKKHHQQYSQPRFLELFSKVATYWEKDDHDYRWDDADPYTPYRGGKDAASLEPSHELGVLAFREQLPVTDPADAGAVTYRTHRLNRDLQIWLVEGRDYRSPNLMPDGPGKTIWGERQLAWLKRTLLESDATFKVLVSPTPLVGPDDLRKKDNHTSIGGFRHEGNAFFAWLQQEGFLNKGFYIATGDRHWQYHSIHPSGFEEFSCGALVRQNSRVGRKPGDPQSTDPQARVRQPFTNDRPTGGFLLVRVTPEETQGRSHLDFVIYSDEGKELYRERKTRNWTE